MIDEYIDRRVDGAGTEIARLVNEKIRDGDVILTYARYLNNFTSLFLTKLSQPINPSSRLLRVARDFG